MAVTQRRTMQDFAYQMRWPVDEAYPDVPVILLVLDNPNTHRLASLYEAFPAPEARRMARRLEFHYTPKHGSWLHMAEIEFSVLTRACLRDATATRRAWERLSTPVCQTATRQKPRSTGDSPPRRPDASSTVSTSAILDLTQR